MDEIDQLVESFNFSQAKALIENKVKADPTNPQLYDKLGEVLLELNDIPNAVNAFLHSVTLAPSSNPSKYLNLAQLSSNESALNYYEKGASLLENELNSNLGDSFELKNILVSTYCAIVELYTTDLCDEPSAESKCETLIEKVYQTLCNLRVIQERVNEAKVALTSAINLIFSSKDTTDSNFTSFDIRLNMLRLCIELEGVAIGNWLFEENDQDLELLYLFSIALYRNNNIDVAIEHLNRILILDKNTPLRSKVEELIREIEESSNYISQIIDEEKAN